MTIWLAWFAAGLAAIIGLLAWALQRSISNLESRHGDQRGAHKGDIPW